MIASATSVSPETFIASRLSLHVAFLSFRSYKLVYGAQDTFADHFAFLNGFLILYMQKKGL